MRIVVTHRKLKFEGKVGTPCPLDFCLEKQQKRRGHTEKIVTCCSLAGIVKKIPITNIFYEILLTSRNDKSIMQYDNDSCQ